MDTKPALVAVEVAERTDPGRDPDKQVNEDACGYRETPFGHLCVVCDGMGGHLNGREASTLALQTILDTFQAAPRPPADGSADAQSGARGRALLEEAITAANRKVFELGGTTKHGRPGSTVVALLLHAGGAEVAHVGDSRCYMIHGSQIFQITKDHSMVQKLVDAQVLTPEQAAVHPDANQILRALGSAADVEVEVRAQTLVHVAGDAFVLCSDGLSDLVEQAEILNAETSAPPEQAASQLVDLANARGGHDNITVMILRAREGSETSASARPREGVAVTVAQTLIAAPVFEPAPLLSSPTAPAGPVGPVQPPAHAAASSPTLPAAGTSSPTLPIEIPPADVAKVPGLVPAQSPAPAPPPPKRRFSAAVAVGILLAAVGIGAAAFAIYLLLNPDYNAKQVAPFALSGLPISSARPPTNLVPSIPEAEPPSATTPAEAGPPPAPLPSLVPSPAPHHRHGW